MTLQHLKNLSAKRIINMKRLYEEAGLSTSSMNSRISLMSGSLTLEEQQAIKLAVVNQIEEICLTLEIEDSHLANALGITEYDIRKGEPVTPCAYLVGTSNTRPVYLPEDKIKRREARTGVGDDLFWTRDKIVEMLVKNTKLTATERGRSLFTEQEVQQIQES